MEPLLAPVITFWLYFNGQPISAVRMPSDTSDQDVRGHARDLEDRCPGGRSMAPFEFRNMLNRSDVRTFDD